MGGYGTYKLGLQWPDLFGRAFTVVGPPVAPGYLNTRQLIENARWLPYLNWAGRTDELVPIGLVRAQQQRFDELGLRSQLWTYPGGHLDLAAGDRGRQRGRSSSRPWCSPTRAGWTTSSCRAPTTGGWGWSTTTPTGCPVCAHARASAGRSAPSAARRRRVPLAPEVPSDAPATPSSSA